jgi:hypothetical protein
MKLLIATQDLAGLAGAPLHTVDLCRGFRRAGYDVSVFTLQPGALSNTLKDEGSPTFLLPDHRSLSKQSFDLVYLHHSTCEVLLGLMFAGKIPIVRGYLGKRSKVGFPTNGNFLSAALYHSEGVRETMTGMSGYNSDIPSIIARNVYDERQFPLGAALRESPHDKPNFAVVTNHLERGLARMLERAAEEGLCRFTHFGHPTNSAPITAELLASFDAVITIFRTVLPTAAMGLPVYMCDVGGADGWLTRESYYESRNRSFSGRRLAMKEWDLVQQQLLDTRQWPTIDDLSWLSGQIEQDHALSRRIEQLESFFVDIVEKAPPPVEPPEGYAGLFQYIDSKGKEVRSVPGDAHRVSELASDLRKVRSKARAQTQRVRKLQRQLEEQATRTQEQEAQNTRLALELQNVKDSRLRKLLGTIRALW